MALTRDEIVEQRVTDFLHCFSGPHGERVLERLSDVLLEKKQTHVKRDSYGSAFNAGKRFGILEIRYWLEYDLTKVADEPDEPILEYDRV